MKKIGFLCCLVYLHAAFGDSIDNALLESLRQSRETTQQVKQQQKAPNDTEDSVKSVSNKDDIPPKTNKKKSHAHSPFRKHIIQVSKQDTTPTINKNESYQKNVWSIGIGMDMQMPKNYANSANYINIIAGNLQIGLSTHIAKEHGFHFVFMSAYNTYSFTQQSALYGTTQSLESFYSVGGAIDYFYNAKAGFFGAFGGIMAYMPIYTPLFNTPSVIGRIGITLTIKSIQNIRMEIYCGFPFYQDSRLDNPFAAGISLHYVFNKHAK